MLKTHKPRGYAWTCASTFQQTKSFRNLKFDDCTVSDAEAFDTGSDDDQTPRQRAAKRRRIERLADDLMNGEPLFISCVRTHAATLKTTVEWNERSRSGTRYSLPTPEKKQPSSPLWVDVEDPWEALRKARFASEATKKASSARTSSVQSPGQALQQEITEEHASSDCKPRRRQRPKISSEPSAEAIKLAAALRARGLQRADTLPPRVEGPPARRSLVDDSASIHSEPPSVNRPLPIRTQKVSKPQWLSARQTTLFELSLEDSVDELSRSHYDTPSRTQRHSNVAAGPLMEHDSFAIQDDAIPLDISSDVMAPVKQELHFGNRVRDVISPKATSPAELRTSHEKSFESYYIEPANTDDGEVPTAQSQEDSQSRLLRSHGISGKPPKAWSALNDSLPSELEYHSDGAADPRPAPTNTSAIREAVQDAAQHAGKPAKGRRAKSAGNSNTPVAGPSTRRRSAPSESQKAVEQMASLPIDQQRRMSAFRAYNLTETTKQGDTPFVFRKKNPSKAVDKKTTQDPGPAPAKEAHRRTTSSYPEEGQDAATAATGETPQTVAAKAPVLDMSFDYDSSFAPKLNMALVDEHLNALLPTTPGASGRASAIKKALRGEMRLSGAEILRAPGEPASSQVDVSTALSPLRMSQQEFNALNSPGVDLEEGMRAARDLSLRASVNSSRSGQSPQTSLEKPRSQWPGTQVLIEQARRDLFSSPAEATHDPGSEASRSTVGDTLRSAPAPSSAARKPLRELSQEQIPSTQAMLNDWSPWSVVKNSKPLNIHIAKPSPLAHGSVPTQAQIARLSNTANSPGTPLTPLERSGRRKSSLRFSTSMSEIPLPVSNLRRSNTTTVSSQEHSKDSETELPPFLPGCFKQTVHVQAPQPPEPLAWTFAALDEHELPNGRDETTEVDTAAGMSSYPAAQRGQMDLMRQVSDLSQALDDVTMGVFDVGDTSAFMSQVA